MNTPDIFEEQLRASLHGAADAHDPYLPDLDPTTVIGAGTRLVRRRRIVTAVATTAAALVVSGGVYAALASSGQHANQDPVPATRGSVTATATATTAPATRASSAELTFEAELTDQSGNTLPAGASYKVSLDPAATPNLTFYAGDDVVGWSQLGGSDIAMNNQTMTWGTGSGAEGLVIGVMPASAAQFQLYGSSDFQGSSQQVSASLPGTELKAFVFRSTVPADAESVEYALWTDGTKVYDSSFAEQPSAAIGAGQLAFDAPEHGVMGTVSGVGFTSVRTAASPMPAYLSHGSITGSGMSQHFTMVVPHGSSNPAITTTSPTVTTVALGLVALSDKSADILYAELSEPGASNDLVKAVSWTAPDGSTSVWTNPGKLSTLADGSALYLPDLPAMGFFITSLVTSEGTYAEVERQDNLGPTRQAASFGPDLPADGVLHLGDGAGFDFAYALLPIDVPQGIDVAGHPATAFTADTVQWGSVKLADNLCLVLIHLGAMTDDGSTGLDQITWTDHAGASHVVAPS